jgi:hypothetical protein
MQFLRLMQTFKSYPVFARHGSQAAVLLADITLPDGPV